jgi:peptide/nickel transport system permease protein
MVRINPTTTFGDRLYMTFLPALTLTLVVVAHMMRMTRAAIINLMASPYIEMARLKGLSPCASSPATRCPTRWRRSSTWRSEPRLLIVGVVVVEVVFVYPGLGQLLVDSVVQPRHRRGAGLSR